MRLQKQCIAIGGAIFLFAAALCLAAPHAAAQVRPARKGDLPPMDAKTQAAVIDSITAALNETYVFADKAARMDSLLRASYASGAYATLTDPAEFMQRLNADVAKIYADRHMNMVALPPGSALDKKVAEDPFNSETYREQMRRSNYAFRNADLLAGNVGYLKFDLFVDTEVAGPTAAAAMGFVANADALIIDLRENGGGSASMIQFLTGYLFKEATHLIDWYSRKENKTTQSWSNDWVPGQKMYDVPVYVLVSGNTGSAAEEFTFDLKNRKRATIVGETTAGAGHTVEFHTYDMGSFVAGLKLPNTRALDPETNVGWEAIGVAPDIAVPADKALAAAHLDAVKKLLEKAQSDRDKFALEWARDGLQADMEPYAPPVKALREYTGDYGPRKIFMEGSRLMYQREGRPKMALVPLKKDAFKVESIDYFRIKFTRDGAGKIDGIVGMYDDGQVDTNPRKK